MTLRLNGSQQSHSSCHRRLRGDLNATFKLMIGLLKATNPLFAFHENPPPREHSMKLKTPSLEEYQVDIFHTEQLTHEKDRPAVVQFKVWLVKAWSTLIPNLTFDRSFSPSHSYSSQNTKDYSASPQTISLSFSSNSSLVSNGRKIVAIASFLNYIDPQPISLWFSDIPEAILKSLSKMT